MKKDIRELIDDWFYSDLDIELKIKKKGRNIKDVLICESDAYYYNGKRYNGELRSIYMPLGSPDEIYDEIKDLLGIFYTKIELIEALKEIEKRGYVLS
ncbi:hypothetical protein SAMN04244560_02267 [Thermoanaerobacter thermohydrosulfuricus]|uniref:Uncharacterized protein n=1 Tax=Thermoanaerobacter thermohydrosulfuricus TaxID=1516 RepID=A0A1G7TTS2_THETY|nr:hypothetical protein [Thermoanaerobacter thermohydrosulfuricus]SDG38678.1 hypothetical protein SAMN04244560_02267 [Thermoanaerobacter thermohydrosulfuricus]